jgi:hypothetical protein
MTEMQYQSALNKTQEIMVKLSTIKNAAILRKAELPPARKRNITRWSSEFTNFE